MDAGLAPRSALVIGGWVASNYGGRLHFRPLEPGLHLLTNLDVNDPTCPRIASSYRLFAAIAEDPLGSPLSADFVGRLRQILSTHDTPLDPRDPAPGNSLCLHLGAYGTRSSSQVFRSSAGEWTLLHTDEAPCVSEYRRQNVSELSRLQ